MKIKLYDKNILSPDIVNQPVEIDCEIIGESDWFVIPEKFKAICRLCGEKFTINLEELIYSDPFFVMSLASIRYLDAIREVSKQINESSRCEASKKGFHNLEITVEGNTGYRIFKIRDIVNPDDKKVEYVEVDLFAFGKIAKQYQGRGKYKVIAIPTVELRSKKLVLLAQKFIKLEENWETFKPSPEDLQNFKKYFSFNSYEELKKIIDETIAPDIKGVSLAKLSAVLTLHSTLHIIRPDGKIIRGWLRTMFYGDTRCGKGSIIRDITLNLRIGERTTGETASRSGLLYVIDPDRRLLVWGSLVLNDGGFLGIEGFHGVRANEVKEFREALSLGIVKVDRKIKGTALARTRIIADMNPKIPLEEAGMYRCQAILNLPGIREPPDITRWDIWIPFWLGMVSSEEIAKSRLTERKIPPEIFRKHVIYVWGTNMIVYEENVEKSIEEFTEKLISKYGSVLIPLINNEAKDLVYRIVVSFACLLNSIVDTDDFRVIRVKKIHLEFAKKFLEELIYLNEYHLYAEFERNQRILSENEIAEYIKTLSDEEIQILLSLAESPKQKDDIRTLLGLEPKELRPLLGRLKLENLIKSAKGYRLTAKGIRLVKYLKNSGIKPKTENKIEENEEKEENEDYLIKLAEERQHELI